MKKEKIILQIWHEDGKWRHVHFFDICWALKSLCSLNATCEHLSHCQDLHEHKDQLCSLQTIFRKANQQ